MNFTSPVTYCWVDSTNAWTASRRGVNHFPSYTIWAILLPMSFLVSMVARSNTSSSSCWWASIRMVPPGVSYTPRDFMPTTRFSTISTMPTPCLPPRVFNLRIMSETFISSPSMEVGTPFSKWMLMVSPSSGASWGVTPSTSRWL